VSLKKSGCSETSWAIFCGVILGLVSGVAQGAQAAPSVVTGGKLASLPLVWSDETGKDSVKFSDWAGKTVVMTLAYTQCRRLCPNTTFKRMRKIQEELKKRGVVAEYVFVTLDPKNDTPARLAQFKTSFKGADEHWHFLTGNPENVKALAAALDFKFWRLDDHVIHDFRIVALDGSGVVSSVLSFEQSDLDVFVTKTTDKK